MSFGLMHRQFVMPQLGTFRVGVTVYTSCHALYNQMLSTTLCFPAERRPDGFLRHLYDDGAPARAQKRQERYRLVSGVPRRLEMALGEPKLGKENVLAKKLAESNWKPAAHIARSARRCSADPHLRTEWL